MCEVMVGGLFLCLNSICQLLFEPMTAKQLNPSRVFCLNSSMRQWLIHPIEPVDCKIHLFVVREYGHVDTKTLNSLVVT